MQSIIVKLQLTTTMLHAAAISKPQGSKSKLSEAKTSRVSPRLDGSNHI